MWDYSNDGQLTRSILITIMLAGLAFACISLSKQEKAEAEIMNNLVTITRERYDTENVTLLKELEENETYLKYELLVEGEIKQAFYIKDTSEVVIIE